MTAYEFLCAQKGFFDLYKAREKSDWHRTIEMINIQLPKRDRIDPDSLFKEKPKRRVISMAERKKEVEKFLNIKIDGTGEP